MLSANQDRKSEIHVKAELAFFFQAALFPWHPFQARCACLSPPSRLQALYRIIKWAPEMLSEPLKVTRAVSSCARGRSPRLLSLLYRMGRHQPCYLGEFLLRVTAVFTCPWVGSQRGTHRESECHQSERCALRAHGFLRRWWITLTLSHLLSHDLWATGESQRTTLGIQFP